MDRFLESFQERSTPQRTLIIVGVAALFLLVLAILYLITAPPRSDTSQTQNTQIPQVTPIPIRNSNQLPSSNSQTYKGQNFDLQYPKEWLGVSQVKDGVEMLKIASSQSSIASYSGIAIYAYFAKDPLFDNLQKQFIAEGFKKTLGKVGGYQAQYFTGEMPMQDGKNKTQQTNILVDLGSKKIIIKYYYLSNSVDVALEEYLKSIVVTVTFH